MTQNSFSEVAKHARPFYDDLRRTSLNNAFTSFMTPVTPCSNALKPVLADTPRKSLVVTTGTAVATPGWTVETQPIGGGIPLSVPNASESVPALVPAIPPRIHRFYATPESPAVTS